MKLRLFAAIVFFVVGFLFLIVARIYAQENSSQSDFDFQEKARHVKIGAICVFLISWLIAISILLEKISIRE